ncbi:MAG: VTT domain-containing protein [Acidobacteriota bacterium]
MTGSIRLIVLVAGAVILSKLLFEDALAIWPEAAIRAWVEQAGTGAAFVVVGLLAADIVLPVPSSLVMILSGAAFGVVWGSALAFVGSVGGEWLGFELVRRYGRRASARIAGDADVARLERIFARNGVLVVAVSRALPVVMETVSVVAGLSGMSRRAFLLASAAGTAPIVVIYAYAGVMSRQLDSVVPAVVILIAVALGGWLAYRHRLAPPPPAR